MRRNRVLKKGATYHVTAAINTRRTALKPKKFKQLFLDVVKEAKLIYDFSLKNFVILDNHIQFLIKPLEDESLSKIMQWILSVFAIRYNKKTRSCGHVWMSRFDSHILEKEEDINEKFKYIANRSKYNNITAGEYIFCGIYYILKKIYEVVDEPDNKLLTICKEFS